MPATNGKYRTNDGRTYEVFKTRLKTLMEAYGLNMKELAESIDLNATSISRNFQDRGPDTIALWRLADKFNVSVDWLLGRSDNKFANVGSEEATRIANLYIDASPSDKLVVETLLKKYDI